MADDAAIIYVIDDDASVRDGLDSLLRSVGFDVVCLATTREFTLEALAKRPACLVLDVRMRGPSGIDFQTDLARRGVTVPVIFLTGHGDVPMSVKAMKAGAVDFLLKPFREQDLLDAVRTAIEKDRAACRDEDQLAKLRCRLDLLTAREKEVMALVVTGRFNKQIAAELGLSEIAIKVNRGHVMRKMAAASLADLVRMADRIGVVMPAVH